MELENIVELLSKLLEKQQRNQESSTNALLESFGQQLLYSLGAKEPSLPRTSIPEYHGLPSEDVNSWLFLVEHYFRAHNVAEDKQSTLAGSFLRSSALQWYRRTLSERGEWNHFSFEDFKSGLRMMFLPRNYQQQLRTKLDQLKQGNNMSRYINDFMNIMNQVIEMSEEDRVHYFIRGLSPKTKAEVGYSCPRNLAHAIELAQNFDSNFFGNYNSNVSSINYPKNDPMEINQVGSNQDKPSSKFNRNNGERDYKSKTSKFCKYCKKNGHLYEDCRKRISNENVKINQSSIYPSESDFIHIDALINDVQATCMIDTGANQSIISEETARRSQLRINPSESKIILADGTRMNILGTTNKTIVQYKHVSPSVSFVVMKNPNHPVLLGMDFLQGIKANIDTINKELILPPICCSASTDLTTHDWTLRERTPQEDEHQTEDDIYLEDMWTSKGKLVEKDNAIQLDNVDLSLDEQNRIVQFLERSKNCFATSLKDLGTCKVKKYKLTTTTEQPIFLHPYRKSYKERQLIKEEINEMLEAKIIRPSSSPWSSPVILVNKPDGSIRFCTDFRALNKVTPHDPFPLPRIDDVFDRLAGSIYFTTIDLKSGYWQIELDEETIPKTAFSTPDGHYEYLRMPFGIKNAPAEFSRIMQQVLGHLPYVQIYLDDITIHSKSFDEHLEHLKHVFKCLKEVDLKINYKKCNFAAKKITLLGHIVSASGIEADPSKVKAVKDMTPPTNVKELQRFLGMTGYYRKFIEGYAGIAQPLYHLLKKENTWFWEEEKEKAFQKLKDKLITSPILRLPDPLKPLKVYTDASGVALGAILAQVDDEGKEYVCHYESRLLKGPEIHYGISEKECLGIVWAIRKFRPYLYGTQFQVITDHSALKWLMSIKDPTGKLARWSVYLQGYDFEIIHRKGTSHLNVDILSRPTQINIVSTRGNSKVNSDPYLCKELHDYLFHEQSRENRNDDKNKKIYERLAQVYSVQDGKLYYKGKMKDSQKVVVPQPETRDGIVKRAHLLGHFQKLATYNRIRQEYYWPTMKRDIEEAIDNCLPCARHSNSREMAHELKSLTVTGLFDRVGIDCTFGFPETSEGYKGILVITEYLSKYPYAVPIKSKTAKEIAEHLLQYICLFGPPKVILSDQGSEFVNQIVDELLKTSGVEHKVTSAYHPQTNGLTERFNQTLIKSIRKHAEKDTKSWDKWIPYVLLAYRTKVHASTGLTPYELIFGRQANTFSEREEVIDLAMNEEAVEDSIFERSKALRLLIEKTRPQAMKNIEKAQERQQKSRNNESRLNDSLRIGSQVFIKSLKMESKLQPLYSGPFWVDSITKQGNYWLKTIEGKRLKNSYPVSRLKLTNISQNGSSNIFEVEKILDHKIMNGRISYFVKWKGYEDDENTWEPEEHFNQTECIEDYWNSSNRVFMEQDALSEGTCNN